MNDRHTGDYTISLITHESRAANQLPIINVNAPDIVDLDEGETFTTTIQAADPDDDPVTLAVTPLFNSTFDPAAGLFTFTPDSAQVNVHDNEIEYLPLQITADDGTFRAVKEISFRVHDINHQAHINEPRMTPPCPADANADGVLNILDFVTFQLNWTAHDSLADCDNDQAFSILDFVCFQQHYTQGCD